jgi:hypothetical protein
MDLTRLQSVLEAFEEEVFFMSSRSPKRDHVNAFAGFQVHDRNSNPIQQAQGDETLLAIGKAIVFIGRCEPFKYAPGIGEVKPVISEICLSLSLIPRKAYLRSVYTLENPVKRRLCRALTTRLTGRRQRRAAPPLTVRFEAEVSRLLKFDLRAHEDASPENLQRMNSKRCEFHDHRFGSFPIACKRFSTAC